MLKYLGAGLVAAAGMLVICGWAAVRSCLMFLQEDTMWSALRELFGGLSPAGRFWLALAVIAALLGVFVTLIVTGVDAGPLWALLGSG